jgi:hypothetical protein
MKNRRCLALCVVLALGLILVFADAGLAQCWGNGPRGPGYQTSQSGCQGYGPGYGRGQGYANCLNYTDYNYCPQGRGNYAYGPRGPRRGMGYNSSNSQTTAPPETK